MGHCVYAVTSVINASLDHLEKAIGSYLLASWHNPQHSLVREFTTVSHSILVEWRMTTTVQQSSHNPEMHNAWVKFY